MVFMRMESNGFASRPWNLHISAQDSNSGNPDNFEGNCLCWAPNFTTPKMALIEQGDSAPPENCQRLVILGSSKVGKTSLVARFLYNKFDDNYTPTIEDFHRKVYRIKGEAYRLDLLDTSGNHPFPAMRRLSMITGDLFVLVYSIDNRDSFEEVSKLCKQIQECKSQCRKETKRLAHVPMMIVGNKCDKEKHRVIDPSEPEMLKEAYHHCGFLETSAKKNINVEESFQNLFDLAKLPVEMSPSLHRRVQPSYIGGNSSQSGKRGMSIRRKMSDACGTIAPNVRRPSIRTDLLVAQMRTNTSGTVTKVPPTPTGDRHRTELRCVIQ